MGHNWLRWALTGLVLLMSVFLISRVVWHMQTRSPTPSVTPEEVSTADAWINGFTYRQTKSGHTKWTVVAERAQVFDADHVAKLEDVRVQLLRNDQQTEEMVVEAERGTIHTATNNFDLDNEHEMMAVQLASGYTIFSNHLTWVEARRELKTDTPVIIRGHGLTITGVGLIGTIDDEEFHVLDDVQVEVAS